MTATRNGREEREYIRYRKTHHPKGCPFCNIKRSDGQHIKSYKYFTVIRNIFPYSLWDGQGVVDHLMVTPKKHTDRLSGQPDAAAIEYVRIVEKYELDGYNVYTRTFKSSSKSVAHYHTHLIKLDGRERWFVWKLKKPFDMRFSR